VRVLRLTRRVALVAVAAALLLGASIAGVLACPHPFFAHHVTEGRLEREGWSVDRLLTSGMTQVAAEKPVAALDHFAFCVYFVYCVY
jgi:hypothetical protein